MDFGSKTYGFWPKHMDFDQNLGIVEAKLRDFGQNLWILTKTYGFGKQILGILEAKPMDFGQN